MNLHFENEAFRELIELAADHFEVINTITFLQNSLKRFDGRYRI
ncbi:hypothetical protein [Proteiniphilum acetatigenes]|nr:hypothetical protein [Proteiniphilum acetatigenes]